MVSVEDAAKAMQSIHNLLNACSYEDTLVANRQRGIVEAYERGLISWDTAVQMMAEPPPEHIRRMWQTADGLPPKPVTSGPAWERAKQTQDEMNAKNERYIKAQWARNHPSEPKRILPWQLSRDDMAELHLWWDWKQLPDDVKSEMLPPPSPSEMTQAFMDTNPAWRFSPAGTLVASLTDSGRREVDDDERDWLGGLAFLIVAMTTIASLVIVIDHIVMG